MPSQNKEVSGEELLIENISVTEMNVSKFQFLEMGFSFMLIANIRISISCFWLKCVYRKNSVHFKLNLFQMFSLAKYKYVP